MAVGLENYALINKVFGLSISEQMELDVLTYNLLLKDAFVYELRQTEEGQEYLEKCWIYKQTKPDRQSLREQFG